VAIESKTNLRERLKAEAIESADRDLALAAEWFPLEEEATKSPTLVERSNPFLSEHDLPLTRRDLFSFLRPERWARDPKNTSGSHYSK
jgi:hypothetical protein